MPVDPLKGFPPSDPQQALAQRIADIERQVRDLQHSGSVQGLSGFRLDAINLATGASADVGPSFTIRVPASGMLEIIALVNLNAGGGPLIVSLLEDGVVIGSNAVLQTSGGPVDLITVPGSNTGVSYGGLSGNVSGGRLAIPGRAAGVHTYSLRGLQGGPGPGTGTVGNRFMWAWTTA